MKQTIKIISENPISVNDNIVCIGIVKDDDYFSILFDCSTNKLYIEILDWGRNHDFENAKFLYINDDNLFNYIHSQIKNFTQIITDKNIQKVKIYNQLYRYSYSKYINSNLPPISNIEDYLITKVNEQITDGFKNKEFYPCSTFFKEIISYLKTKLTLCINRNEYYQHYINLYIKIYKEKYAEMFNKSNFINNSNE